MSEHCWHPNGHGTSNAISGGWFVQCCFCGARATQPYRIETHHIEGHGPHFTESRVVADPVAFSAPCTGFRAATTEGGATTP